ncbi:Prolyl 4-hydroxylase alpha-related protein PH4[alpha]EFB [Strongyloides ratti]|uniref:procollagen-proline 4-dioxygenase n=1 Tax=Strongyloides ratti TaxID=34506 RepID=A0A090MNG0_STRRB|nr:Prolyl 4-hydroxylase alpha-related protein PH4[alpha]EFB [Strongyloides ratti]CEF59606.1 Prolyl 4-hydroxylase alpha-related protein PH4[alpha]EFB [Strongyloides ratti]
MLLILSLCAIITFINGDLFTAMVDLENLKESERDIGYVIEEYIKSEEERLNKLKEYANEYKVRLNEKKDITYITNPINAYTLIKKMSVDWKNIQQKMNENKADEFLEKIKYQKQSKIIKYPDDEDLTGAANALVRLQDTYNLSTTELADGIIQGQDIKKKFTAHDCFEIGRAAYNDQDYYHVVNWMQEALMRLENETPRTVEYTDILEYLAFALFKQGNVKRALALTKKLASIETNHPRAIDNIKWYEDMLTLEDKKNLNELPPIKNERLVYKKVPEQNEYESLCRGESTISISQKSKLYCYYKRDRPFLKLAPIKVEIVHFNPLAVLFKEIISDEEISVIESLAIPRLKRATVQNAKTGELETASYRISKSAWLKDGEHPVIHRINKRIGDMTNLNQDTSEDLQVANYGLGGHYDPHFDFARKEETNAFKRLGTGNRIATVLFYMSQPERGGATVFTELGLPQFPVHHDALFWYNLKRNGDGDVRTRHAACPVLTGVKWVSNKWIHERGQEFTRPCGLTEDIEEQFVGDLRPF